MKRDFHCSSGRAEYNLDILRLNYVAKVGYYDDHPCKKFLEYQDHRSINRTTLMDNNIFHNTPLIALL